jgi:hypothetical protein
MKQRIALFWPGDAREKPNQLALPNAEEATQQLEHALTRLGRTSYRVPGFLSKPHEAIEKLYPVQDGVVVARVDHWIIPPWESSQSP